MRATGIIRRMDDLGRVVIPKELRRQMAIKEGDAVEIYTDHNGEIIFRKYGVVLEDEISSLNDMIEEYGGCTSEQIQSIHKHLDSIKQVLKENND